MATLQEICRYCESLLHPELFEDGCTNGLQVGGKQEVVRLAAAVSASLNVIERAKEWGADLLLVHHGLFWKGETRDIVGPLRSKLRILLEADLSLLAYHLPLDAHREIGNNWRAALDLGWQELVPFPSKGRESALGVSGTFPAVKPEEFTKILSRYYGRPVEALLVGSSEMIQSAALVSGGAHKQITWASSAGVDAFITGSRDEPTYHQAREYALHFFAVGHSASERVGPRALASRLAERFSLETCFLEESNPF